MPSSNEQPRDWATLIQDHEIDESRSIKVICVGAGISGILTGIRLPQQAQNLELTFARRTQRFEELGTRTTTLESVAIFPARGISSRSRARLNGASSTLAAPKSNNIGQLGETIRRLPLLWNWPSIPGFETFKGPKVHTARLDTSLDLNDREVALIGAGLTGIQILPAIQPIVKRIDHYMKGKNWTSHVGIGGDELARRNAIFGNFKHSPEELDPPIAAFFGTDEQKQFHVMSKKFMEDKLVGRPDILKALMPEWTPGCRRSKPGPGDLEACCQPNVDYISTKIKQIHEDRIETGDVQIMKVDVILCATGFDVSHQSGPKITGQKGQKLHELWDPSPEAYMSMCPPCMPNMLIYFGPNGGPLTGSTILMLEWICDYAIASIQKLQREFFKSMVVKPDANKDFSRHIDKFFKKTVFTQPSLANWIGSGVHSRKTLLNPRWEDFDYEPMSEVTENRYAWLGNGMTIAQRDGMDPTEYLDLKQYITNRYPSTQMFQSTRSDSPEYMVLSECDHDQPGLNP
ncbi:hypothetical protein LTS07_011356 [Exophiala sideris]|uniref:FAD/NAD(P)-binding domain-containing protein n=1 Tax=Exophiala sideris TaxID=1016849 RepID=A0ABR0IUG5_9EURO|nr:hypothetical protein LTS07_011356 [Exophiala sideris]KAK5048468.1 hypothetical protein LTR69_011336 [Exophiala sideris]KAK5176040.1 hypothetical protein LTR44_011399 [Eurotiomycetes sp. CCFEE 6388]